MNAKLDLVRYATRKLTNYDMKLYRMYYIQALLKCILSFLYALKIKLKRKGERKGRAIVESYHYNRQ